MGVQRQLPYTKISAKGQIVIPSLVREKFGWAPGVKVIVQRARFDEITIRKKKPKASVSQRLCGSLKDVLPSTRKYLADKKKGLKLE